VTGGIGAARLLPELAPRLSVTRQVTVWVGVDKTEPFEAPRLPCWGIDDGRGVLYGTPLTDPAIGLKVSRHEAGPVIDPEAPLAPPTDDEIESLVEDCRRFLRGTGESIGRGVCRYCNSPDGHFILDRLEPRVIVACGLSGHGFKFAPVLGEALADLATMGRTDLPIDFLSRDRLGGGGGA